MGLLDGVVATRVGYAGGKGGDGQDGKPLPPPTYRAIRDYTETVRVTYDPSRISYRSILDHFFSSHNPNKTRLLRQYASIVFAHSEQQQVEALEARTHFERKQKFKCTTEIIGVIPADTNTIRGFYDAEDYHQKYILRQYPSVMEVLSEIVNDNEASDGLPEFAFLSGVIPAKINGYLHAGSESLYLQIEHLVLRSGAKDSDKARLLEILREI
jgi:peptide-methionine (S)-S-oxide reductase